MKKILGGVLFVLSLALSVHAQNITSVAGNSSWGRVWHVSLDAAGNIYAPDEIHHVVWKVDKQGVTTIAAGTLDGPGYAGDGGQAASAKLNRPTASIVAPDGTWYISDYNNARIRKVAPNGVITTYAGTGVNGFTGDGGQATSARIYGPFTMVLDPNGVLYFVDILNRRIRKIAANGVITTVGGSGGVPAVSDGDGSLATATNMLPGYIARTDDGTIYFSDDYNPNGGVVRIRKISPTGTVTTVAGDGKSGYTGDGNPATAAEFASVNGIVFDSAKNLFVAEYYGNRIRKIAPTGIITTYAGTGQATFSGDGGKASAATLYAPAGLTMDSEDNLFVSDLGNKRVRKISPVPTPTISSTSAAVPSFLGRANFGSNMFLEIYGTNLASTSRGWAASDFKNGVAATTLDGVSVTVNGRPAFINYVSPGQVNINTPDDTAIGPVNIQVTNSYGVPSNVGSAIRARVSPSLHTVTLFNVGGKQYVAAHTPDFSTFIGRPGMIAGVPFAAAKPGDVVIIFALGCGPTNPAVAAGTIAPQTSPLALPYKVFIGGAEATVQFAGMIANNVGLYQLNVVIPNVSPGDQSIELQVDGVGNAQNLVITVGQ